MQHTAYLVKSLFTGETLVEHHADIKMYPASAIKVLIALVVIRQGIRLETVLELSCHADLPVWARWFPNDDTDVHHVKHSVRELLSLMLINSNNCASNNLVQFIGLQAIQSVLGECGIDSVFGNGFPEQGPLFRKRLAISLREICSIYSQTQHHPRLLELLGRVPQTYTTLPGYVHKTGRVHVWNGKWFPALKRFCMGEPVVLVYEADAGMVLVNGEWWFVGAIIEYSAFPWCIQRKRLGAVLESILKTTGFI